MHYIIKKLFLPLFFILLCNTSIASEKISYLDINMILNESNPGKSLLSQLNKINKKNIDILQIDESNLRSLEEEMKINKNIVSEEELKKKIDLFNKELNFLNKKKNKLLDDFTKLRNKEIINFMNMIKPLIEDYMDKNSIVMIIDKKNIFIAKSNYDITDDMLVLINQKIKEFKINY